jgi:hypothetical protein
VPAKSEPIITVSAPAAMALAMSPEYLQAAVGDERDPAGGAGTRRAVGDGGDLRHADAGDDARGADRARPDADLDRVGARVDEGLRPRRVATLPPMSCTCRVAGSALSRLDHLEQEPGVAVGGVDDEHVDAGLDERGRALPGLAEVADRRADEQAPVGVLAGMGELLGLHEVLDGDQPGEAPLSSTIGSRSRLCWRSRATASSRADADRRGDQRHRRHDVARPGARPLRDRGEAQVAVGDDAEQVVVDVDDGQAGDAVLPAERSSRSSRVASGPMVTGLEIMPVWVRLTRSTW